MSWVQSDLDKLEKAIATGAKSVKFADKQVDYNSLQDMLAARDIIRRALGKTAGTTRILIAYSKGLNK